MMTDNDIIGMYASIANGGKWEYSKTPGDSKSWKEYKLGDKINKNWSYRKFDPNKDKWVAVMFGADLRPMLHSDGYAGYGCPLFDTREECVLWIENWEEQHKGEWLKSKSWISCNTPEESAIFERGVTDGCIKALSLVEKKINKEACTAIKRLMIDYMGVKL